MAKNENQSAVEKGKTIKDVLHGILRLLLFLGILNIILKLNPFRLNWDDFKFFIEMFSLWGVFEWIIRIDEATKKLDNAKNIQRP